MPQSKPTSTQIGAVAVNLVANALILDSQGDLAPFHPVADDEGIDLLVYHKPSGRVLPVQVKARTVTLKRSGTQLRGNTVHFEVRKVVVERNRRTYLLCVLLGEHAKRIQTAWLLPLSQVPAVAAVRTKKYVMRANRNPASADKYSQFRCDNSNEIVDRLSRMFHTLQ
jgi:hypothetical protein